MDTRPGDVWFRRGWKSVERGKCTDSREATLLEVVGGRGSGRFRYKRAGPGEAGGLGKIEHRGQEVDGRFNNPLADYFGGVLGLPRETFRRSQTHSRHPDKRGKVSLL